MSGIKFRYICERANGEKFTLFVTLEQLETGQFNIGKIGSIERVLSRDRFTNLADKNDKDIYENDLYKDAAGDIGRVELATTAGYGWGLFGTKKGSLYWTNICTATQGVVIGNATDNPELLTGDKK